MLVAVAGLGVFDGGGAVVSVTGTMVGAGEMGMLTDPQAARRITAHKINPTRYLLFMTIVASLGFIIHAETLKLSHR